LHYLKLAKKSYLKDKIPRSLIIAYWKLGISFQKQNFIDKTFKCYLEINDLFNSNKLIKVNAEASERDIYVKLSIYYFLGCLYYNQKNNKEGINSFLEAYKLYSIIKDKIDYDEYKEMNYELANIARLLYTLGEISYSQLKINEAMVLLKEALVIYNRIHTPTDMIQTVCYGIINKTYHMHEDERISTKGVILYLLGSICYIQNNFDQALKYYNSALGYLELYNFKKLIGETFFYVGIININLGNKAEAKENMGKAKNYISRTDIVKLKIINELMAK